MYAATCHEPLELLREAPGNPVLGSHTKLQIPSSYPPPLLPPLQDDRLAPERQGARPQAQGDHCLDQAGWRGGGRQRNGTYMSLQVVPLKWQPWNRKAGKVLPVDCTDS